jgi:hypothetical protein
MIEQRRKAMGGWLALGRNARTSEQKPEPQDAIPAMIQNCA